MARSRRLWLAICGAVLIVGCMEVAQMSSQEKVPGMTLFVALNGNDAWSGKLPDPNAAKTDGPFTTLERARDEIRSLKKKGSLPEGGVAVELRGGAYELNKAFDLTAEDSGTETAPITYRARRGEEVRLVGGKLLSGFVPVTDAAVLARLEEAGRGKVMQTDLRAQGVSDFGQMGGGFGQGGGPGLELFFNDQPMTVARWPKDGFIRIMEVLGATPVDVRGTKGCKEGKFVYEGDRPKRWVGEKDAWVLGYWFWDWAEQRHKIESLDPEKRIIAVAPPYHGYGYRKGQWFYGFNILAELGAPGEWYLDRDKGILYFWPPEPIEKGRAMVSVLPTLVAMKDVSHVTIRGMILEGARDNAVTISGGEKSRIAACTLRNIGSWAVKVAGGTGHSVVGCDVTATGDGGISMDGGDRKTLTPAGHVAENNHVHHWSRWNRMYRPAIMIGGVGNRVAHNLLENAPHTAIGFGGNDHVIEFNEIHSVCYESNDAGVIYTGRNWTMRGHMIRHNYIHHICGFEGRGCVGVYLDDMFSSATIYGNVFYEVTRAAFIGGGRDNTIENNIFVDCRPAVHVDARALGWAHACSDGWIKEGHEKGTLSGTLYNKPPYSERYPKLINILNEDPASPCGNVIARNICVGGKWDEIEKKALPLVTFQDNLLDRDPKFVDAKKLNFQLRDDSPAFKLGFRRIPIEKIGLYKDALRASWPVTHTVRPMPAPPPPRPVRTGPPAVFKVPRAGVPIAVDGDITPAEWGGADPAKAMVIAKGIHDEPLQPKSWAWLTYDDLNLYIAIRNDVDPAKPLAMGAEWGRDDAVEVALQDPAGKKAPVFVLRGYPNGRFESSNEADAPADAVRKAGESVRFAAKVLDKGHWAAEYCIPFSALGMDPARQTKLAFNLSVRKTATSLWLLWQGTGAQTWRVDQAGFIELAK